MYNNLLLDTMKKRLTEEEIDSVIEFISNNTNNTDEPEGTTNMMNIKGFSIKCTNVPYVRRFSYFIEDRCYLPFDDFDVYIECSGIKINDWLDTAYLAPEVIWYLNN